MIEVGQLRMWKKKYDGGQFYNQVDGSLCFVTERFDLPKRGGPGIEPQLAGELDQIRARLRAPSDDPQCGDAESVRGDHG